MSFHTLINNQGELSQGLIREALDAIHSNQVGQAHRLLLQAFQIDSKNTQIWLLLGWTAPNSDSATFYFQRYLEQHPDSPLAGEILQSLSHKSGSDTSNSKINTHETKEFIIKAIAHLERPVMVEQLSDTKTWRVDSHLGDRNVKQAKIRTMDKKIWQSRFPKNLRIPLAYLAAMTLAEGLTTLVIPHIGLIFHGLLLVTLILHATLFADRGEQRFLMTLTLAPLIRLMSLSMPLLNFPFIYWYAMIGVPLTLAAFLVLRVTGFKAAHIGLNGRALPWQLVIGLTGLIFGYMEYIILRPAPLIKALTWQQIWLPALILLVFTGFLEEFIFRGIIQRGAAGTIGRYGLIYVSALFAVLHIGYRSVWDVVFVFMVALFFGVMVARTGSLLGVTLAHGLTNISLYLVIPFLMNVTTNPVTAIPKTTTDTTSIPMVWSTLALNTKLITPCEADNGNTYLNTLSGIFKAKTDVRPDWVFFDHKETKITEKWFSIYSDNGILSVDDHSLPKINIILSAPHQSMRNLVTVE